MSNQIAALVSTLVISLVSLSGIVFFSFRKDFFAKLVFALFSFAVGSLLGNTFFGLLPEAYEQIADTKLIAWLILGGFLAFFVMEQMLGHRHASTDTPAENVKSYGYLCLFADAIHNFTDGILIGAAWLVSPEIGLATSVGILFHEIPQEISDFAILVKAGFSRGKALLFNFYSATSAILGTALILIFNDKIDRFSAYILPFAAGGFVYLAAASLIPELTRNKSKRQTILQFGIILLGLLMMFFLNSHEHNHL